MVMCSSRLGVDSWIRNTPIPCWHLADGRAYLLLHGTSQKYEEVIFLKGRKPASYSSVDLFRVLPEREIGMVSENSDWDFCGCYMQPPVF